ncbi:hypothetical protein [Limnoglobus roseus]|uniref:Outer membrane protein assembly factor BamE n=1 Tax=Limnoglobus roseus TaxID=2598579 RepID=A0A5C1ANX8_9BACT|nr:hypothetical protein [Limnoglobus roseus]QEL19843.1 hypothetical protein PX52LOC_06924 [Limnoglobus roseus]
MLGRYKWRIVSIALFVSAVIGGLGALDRYLDPFDDQPFDPAAWAAADEREQDRAPMARAAAAHLSPGTPESRVRELLGEPTSVTNREDRWGVRPRTGEMWEYWLGCWSGMGPYGWDSASLYVHFGPDGRVTSTEITGG